MTIRNQNVGVYIQDRNIVIDMGLPDEHMVLTPPRAVEFANVLIDAATQCGYEVQVQVQHPGISDAKRLQLIVRAGHILRSLQEQHKDSGFIATQITDAILMEVL